MNTAMSLPGGPPDPELFAKRAPGVEMVADHPRNEQVMGASGERLIGVLHRRLISKLIVARRESGAERVIARWENRQVDADPGVGHIVDLTSDRISGWDERVALYGTIGSSGAEGRTAVRIRGLDEDEPAILVDGRPTPGCIVDLAVSATAFADPMRDGQRPLTIVHCEPRSSYEADLWSTLMQLCQDRLGVDRGVLRTVASPKLTMAR